MLALDITPENESIVEAVFRPLMCTTQDPPVPSDPISAHAFTRTLLHL